MMKTKLSKLFITTVAVLVMLGMVPADFTAESNISPFTVTAQAASKKTQLKKTKLTLTVGKTYTQKLLDKKGKTISATKIKWKSANKKIATVSKSGKVTGKKAGTVKITATYKNKKYTCTITVKKATSKKTHLKKSTLSLTVGETYTQKLLDKKDKTISATKIKWKSANKKIATVSKNGKVTGKKAGKVKITATYKSKNYTFTVTVKKAATKPAKGDPDNDDSKSSTVYRTPTGKRYHIDAQCGGKNSYSVTKDKAIKASLTPCKTCVK